MTDTKILIEEIKSTENWLAHLKEQLRTIHNNCSHDWATQYTPIYEKAYTIPGDAPGTMGVDWIGPVHVPAKDIPEWTRTCRRCGKTEKTQKVTENVTKFPKF